MSTDKPSDLSDLGRGAAGSADAADDDLQRARRRLLKMALYVPPAVIGTLLVGRVALAASCAPNAGCSPNCAPNATCNPHTPCGPGH
jgi:hypothetical protein